MGIRPSGKQLKAGDTRFIHSHKPAYAQIKRIDSETCCNSCRTVHSIVYVRWEAGGRCSEWIVSSCTAAGHLHVRVCGVCERNVCARVRNPYAYECLLPRAELAAQVGLSTATKLCQCSNALVKCKRPMPVQADGEPWGQPCCDIRIRRVHLRTCSGVSSQARLAVRGNEVICYARARMRELVRFSRTYRGCFSGPSAMKSSLQSRRTCKL
jgi:hypothetical protein